MFIRLVTSQVLNVGLFIPRQLSMAVLLRRFNAVASSGSLFRQSIKNRTEYLDAFPEASSRGVHGFSSTSFDQNGNLSDPSSLGGVTGSSGERFHSWPNGGGTFHESASFDPTTCVEMGAIIHEKTVLGANVCVGSGTVIGPSDAVGKSSWIGYNVSLSNCTIGESCVIHSGVRVSQDGFGFFVDECGQVFKKPQTLNARIGNNVEIGTHTCIDRGSWRDTEIGDCTKIDNLVQIDRGIIIGKNCLLCGQVGIAGSASLGDYVVLGGRAAVKDHVIITSKVRLAVNSCVIKDIKDPGDYGRFPAVPIGRWTRQVATGRASFQELSSSLVKRLKKKKINANETPRRDENSVMKCWRKLLVFLWQTNHVKGLVFSKEIVP